MIRELRRIGYPQVVLIVVLVSVNFALVGAVTSSTAPHGPFNTEWDGGSTLRTTAASGDTSVTLGHDTSLYEEITANGTVAFVVAPKKPYSSTSRARIRQFIQRGGTLVLATETNRTNRLLADLGVVTRVDGRPLRDLEAFYRDPALPEATNVSTHPFTADIDTLTLNYATVLNISRDNQSPLDGGWSGQVLVTTSRFAYVDANSNQTLDQNETLAPRPVVTVEPAGAGRVIVVSDASVFTNAMLEREGNKQFATGLVDAHERVLLDYSHGEPLPPLVYGLLVVRATPLLQFGLGLAAIGTVIIWTYRRSLPLSSVLFGGHTQQRKHRPLAEFDEEELSAVLSERHPEWDDTRIEHVMKAIKRQRQKSDDND